MNFNGLSPLSDVLQISHNVSRDAAGNLEVSLDRSNSREDIKKATGHPESASRYSLHDQVGHTGEYILLNNTGFVPAPSSLPILLNKRP